MAQRVHAVVGLLKNQSLVLRADLGRSGATETSHRQFQSLPQPCPKPFRALCAEAPRDLQFAWWMLWGDEERGMVRCRAPTA